MCLIDQQVAFRLLQFVKYNNALWFVATVLKKIIKSFEKVTVVLSQPRTVRVLSICFDNASEDLYAKSLADVPKFLHVSQLGKSQGSEVLYCGLISVFECKPCEFGYFVVANGCIQVGMMEYFAFQDFGTL